MVSVQVRPPSELRNSASGTPAQMITGSDGSIASANTRGFLIGPLPVGAQFAPPSVDLKTPELIVPA